jgi:tetratricopeptide (TPR) repeat protein
MLVEQGRLKEARELWEGRTSDDDQTHPQLIQVLTWAENLARATDALAQKPDDPDALIDMGLAVMEGPSWMVDGREKRALVYFQKVLAVNPNNARAQLGIVKAYVQIARTFDSAKADLERELAKLRRMDPKLADEAEDYRKHYGTGANAGPVGPAGPAGPTGPAGPAGPAQQK